MGFCEGVALSQHPGKVIMMVAADYLDGGASVLASRWTKTNLNGSRGRSSHLSVFGPD
jgi:hypothetical protein